MIYEFALDPALVARWSDPREYRAYQGRFGVGTPRIPSRVPNKHWRRMVLEEFNALVSQLNPQEVAQRRLRLAEIVKPCLVGWAGRACTEHGTWLEMATREHHRRAFQALLLSSQAGSAPKDVPTLRDPDFDPEDALWSPEQGLVPKTPRGFVGSLRPLLSFARTLHFIDPHFDPSKKRWQEPLFALLEEAVRGRQPHEQPEVQLHTCVTRGRSGRGADGLTAIEKKTGAEKLLESFHRVKQSIPSKLRLAVFVWAERPAGREFHDRFLLTEFGGVQFGKGLDASQEGGRTELITMLPRKAYSDLMTAFQPRSEVYDLIRSGEIFRD